MSIIACLYSSTVITVVSVTSVARARALRTSTALNTPNKVPHEFPLFDQTRKYSKTVTQSGCTNRNKRRSDEIDTIVIILYPDQGQENQSSMTPRERGGERRAFECYTRSGYTVLRQPFLDQYKATRLYFVAVEPRMPGLF